MKIRFLFLPHALERMVERGISQELVKAAVEFPDKVEKSSVHPS